VLPFRYPLCDNEKLEVPPILHGSSSSDERHRNQQKASSLFRPAQADMEKVPKEHVAQHDQHNRQEHQRRNPLQTDLEKVGQTHLPRGILSSAT
jgi:hypothetical protein